MGLRIRGGRRGNFKSSLSQHISARGRRIATENRPLNPNRSTCSSEKVTFNILSNSDVIERRKRNEELNQSVLRTFDQHKSLVEEEKFSRKLDLELEKTMNVFNIDLLSSKSSLSGDKGSKTKILNKIEETGLETTVNGVLGEENGRLSKNVEGTDRSSSLYVSSEEHHSSEVINKTTSEIQNTSSYPGDDRGTVACKNAKSYGNDHPNSIQTRVFSSKEGEENVHVGASPCSRLTLMGSEKFYGRKTQGLTQHRMATMGQQKGYKYFNKLSKKNRLNFFKLASDRNPIVTKVSKSLSRDLMDTPKAVTDDNCGSNRRLFQSKSPRKYLNSYSGISTFVKEMDMESCPGTSSGNKVITSGDMSTLPMILRSSVMNQNSDSEKDDDEDVAESNIGKDKNGINEVIDVIDGIEFVTFENEHDMVQFTRLASDEFCKGDLVDLSFSSEFPETIIPKKTKDIKKIKGWQKKKFAITQNPMLDPNIPSGSELAMINNLCPEIIEYEHNYMRRKLENILEEEEDCTDCEDELPGLSLDGSSVLGSESDHMNKLEDCLAERDEEDKISVWKPSEKSAFVSFSASNADAFDISNKDVETGPNTRSDGAVINQLKDPSKLSTCTQSEQQSSMDHDSFRSMATLSPTSIIMNKMKMQTVRVKAKIIKVHKSVQVDLAFEKDINHQKRRKKQRIAEEELFEWSQSYEDIWHIDQSRALFAASAVTTYDYHSTSHKLPDSSKTKLLLKQKDVSPEAVQEPPSQRRLLRSSTKKKSAPVRLTRSSVSASKLDILDPPTLSCISKSSNHRKSNSSLKSLVSPSKNSSVAEKVNDDEATSSNFHLDQSDDEVHQVKSPSGDTPQDSSISKTSNTLSSPELHQGLKFGSVKCLPPNKCTSKELQTDNLQSHPPFVIRRKEKRRLIARQIWNLRRMRKIGELGMLDSNFKGEFPRVSDLVSNELRKYYHSKSKRVKNSNVNTTEFKCDDGNENSEIELNLDKSGEDTVVDKHEKGNCNTENKTVGNVGVAYKNSSSSLTEEKNLKQGFKGNENRPELENEELTVFLKPKPRPQFETLSPVKTSKDSSIFYSSSHSKIETNHPSELSPPKKTEVEIIKSKSPSSPSLSRKKLIRELQKLNANFVSVDPDKKDSVEHNCPKEFCRLGCVCNSIKTDKRLVDHCGKIECMFSCICPSSESAPTPANHLVIGSDTVSRLQEESSRHMAKVEKYFHHTVVEAAGELVLPGRQQRERRLPKRFLDESIIPEVLLNPKKSRTSDSNGKVTVNQSPVTKKVLQPQRKPQYKECYVNLSQIPSLQTNVRCINHAIVNCPCIAFNTPGRLSRNVAIKSTMHLQKRKMEDVVIPPIYEVVPEEPNHSSFGESSNEMSAIGIISEVQSLKPDSEVENDEEFKGCAVDGKNGKGLDENSGVKEIICNKLHEENATDTSRQIVHLGDNSTSDHCTVYDKYLQCSRTSGIDFWVSQLPLDKQLSKGITRVNKASTAVPQLVTQNDVVEPYLTEETPKTILCSAREVSKDILTVDDVIVEAAPKEEDNVEAALKIKEVGPAVASQISMENSGSGTDLSDLVKQDDSMPLFKIVEVKSLPPSSFESDLIAPAETDVSDEMNNSFSNLESYYTIPLDTNVSGEGRRKRVSKTTTYFTSLESFDFWLKSNSTRCGDLEKMCSKSLKPLPLNSVIIMKWSHLNKLVQCHSAHLWMRQRFGTNSSSNSQVFVTQKDRPPDAACVNFLDLEKKGSLCTQVAVLLRNSKSGNMSTKSCGILISRGCFWEISGHIKLGIANQNNLQNIALRKKNSNSSVSNYKLKASEDAPENIVSGVDNPVSKRFHQSSTILHPVAENSLNKNNAIVSPTLERNALNVTGKVIGRTTDPFAESSDLSESTVRVELDLETSFLSVLDNQQNLGKIMMPNCNLETDNFSFDFEKYSIKDGTCDLTAAKNERLSQSNLLSTKCKSGIAERSNPAFSDSVLNLERIPGNLESASFAKQKQSNNLSKLEPELQSHATNTGSGLAKYVVGENIAGTSNFFQSGSFSQSLEPPSQIFQFEEVEPVVKCQQLICPDSRSSQQKREENNLKLSQSEMNTDLQSNSSTNLHSKKTNIHSSVTTEEANINQDAKCGNSLSGAKPSVLIIDLNKLRQGNTVPSKKSEPLALRVTEIKSLAQGFDTKTRIDTSEKNSPVATRVNSSPQVTGPMLPAVIHSSKQIPVNKEKIIISKSLPLHLCKDSVVVTCPSINVPCEEITLPSKAIHVNIIKDVNPVSHGRKKIPKGDTGNVFKVNEGGERISIKSETQRNFLGNKVAIPKLVRQKKSKVAQEKILRVSNPNGMPVVLISENSRALNNEASLNKLNIDLNSVSSRPISTNNSQLKQVTVSGESSLGSDKLQEGSKVTPSSINQVIISEDTFKGSTDMRKEHKFAKLKSEFNSRGNNQQLPVPQDLPKSPLPIVNVEKNIVSLEPTETTDVLPTSVPEGAKPKIRVKTKEALLESRFSCIDDDNSPAKVTLIDQTENAKLRPVGDSIKPSVGPEIGEIAGLYSSYMSHEEISVSAPSQKTSQSALKVASRVWKNSFGQPIARQKKPETWPSFNGKSQMEPLESTKKQVECDEGVRNELIFGSESSTPVCQSESEYMTSELELLLKTSPRTLKSFCTSKKSVTGSSDGAKETETAGQHLHNSSSSSSDVFTSKFQSPKKALNQYPGKFSTQTLGNNSSHLLTSASWKASTQISNEISTKAIGKASAQSLARASDCTALPNTNLSVVEVSNSPILIEETEPNSSAKIKEKASLSQYDSVLFSGDAVAFKSQSVKDSKMSSSPCKKYVARNALSSMKKSNLLAQHAHPSPLSSSGTSKNHSPKAVASDSIIIPTVNQDVLKTSNTPSRVKTAVPQSQLSAAKKDESKSSSKHSSPRDTSMCNNLPLKKGTSVCVSSPSTSTLKQTSSSSNPLESESSTVTASSDSSSSCAIPEKSMDNDVIWYRLDLNGEFDKLTYEETGFSTSASRLISAVMIAKTSNRTVRLVFDKSQNNEEVQQFKRGIYAVPTVNGNYVKIGPYKPNEPTGVKTSKKMKNNRYEDVPDLLGIEVDTLEAGSMTGDMNAEKQKDGGSTPEGTQGEMKQQENKENNFASPGNAIEINQKIAQEESQIKCKSPRIEANDESKAPVEEHKNADSFSSGTESVEKNHPGMALKIPMVSLTRLSLNADQKQSTLIEQNKFTDDEPLPKRAKVANPDVNFKLNVSKCEEDDSESSLTEETHGDMSSVQASKVEEYSLIDNTGELCNALDLEMNCPNEGDSLIYGKGGSSGPASSVQVKEGDDQIVNVTNVSGGCQHSKAFEHNEGSVHGTKSASVIEKAEVPTATGSTKPSTPDKCLNNGKKKLNVARKSITIKPASMENTMMKNDVSHKRVRMGMKAKGIGQISSGKTSWKRKVVIPPLITLKESDIQSEEMYECGYLIPNNPKVDPIPAKKCLIPSESSAIIFQDPGRPGVFVKFEDIGDISNYIEHNLQKCIRSFPTGLKIEWTYSKEKPSPEGLTKLGNSLKDTEVAQLANNDDAKPRSNRMMEDIENAKARLLSLILPQAISNDVNLEEAIKQALEEISSLQNHDEHLCQTYVVEKRRKLKLVEKLRPLLKAVGMKTVSEFNDRVAQLTNSPKEDLDEISDAGRNLKDRSKRGRCSKREQGRVAEKIEETGDIESGENFCQTNETRFSNSNNDIVKEISCDPGSFCNGRVLRSTRNSKPSVEFSEIIDKPVPDGNLISSSSSSGAGKTTLIKDTIPQKITSASPDTVRKLISSIVGCGPDNEGDNSISEVMNSEIINLSSEGTSSQDSAGNNELVKNCSGEVKPVDVLLWKNSFSQVKTDQVSLRGGNIDSPAEIPAFKKQLLRNKINQKQRANPKRLGASDSMENPQTSNSPSKKRRS